MINSEKVSYKLFRKAISKIIRKYPQEVRAWLDEVYLLDVD